MSKQPMSEVFGFPIDNMGPEATRHRNNRLCPFNNNVPNCTKDKANNPIGVCSFYNKDEITVTCPVRFRENWIIADYAAEFFFPSDAKWTSLTDIFYRNKYGQVGKNDLILISYDDHGSFLDFGVVNIMASNLSEYSTFHLNKVSVDSALSLFDLENIKKLSSIILNGSILKEWNNKQAIMLQGKFFESFPTLPEVSKQESDIAFFLYDFESSITRKSFNMTLQRVTYSSVDLISKMLGFKLNEKKSTKLISSDFLIENLLDNFIESGGYDQH